MPPEFALVLLLAFGLGALPLALLWLAARRRARAGERRGDLLSQAMEATSCHFAVYDRDRVLVACNSSYRKLHVTAFRELRPPIRYDDLMRIAIAETMPPALLETELAKRIAKHEAEQRQPFDRLHPGGRWVHIDKRRLPGGEVAGFAIDITAIKAREAALETSEARYRALVEDAPVGIWHVDADGRTVFANERLSRLFTGGQVPHDLKAAALDLPMAESPDHPFGLVPGRETEVALRRPKGDATLLIAASPWITGADGTRGTVLTVLDTTALRQARDQLEHLARHDPLTGLGNRDAFQAALNAMLGQQGGTVLLIDLDDFKLANDQHGHAAGDAVLVAVAQRLRAAVRPTDLVARLGGDEFAVVAPLLATDGARSLGRRLTLALAEPIQHQGVSLRVGVSIGTALAPLHGATPDALVRAADLALYEAKATGRGRAIAFRPALRDVADSRSVVREALPDALRDDELTLHFQPQRDLATGALVGAEALLRWPSRRLRRSIPPDQLFAACRDARLSSAIDGFVLNRAVEHLAAWRAVAGAPPRLAINITVATLRDPAFPDRVAELLLRHEVRPGQLEIELPEDLALRDVDVIGPNLGRLRELGIRLALDDFGAGLSSLAHVVRLPVQMLKLDRSIVAGLDGPTPPRAVLRATVALARGMGIEVLAEGVETEAQCFALRREGCTIAQGYLLGRPQPEAELLGGALSSVRIAS